MDCNIWEDAERFQRFLDQQHLRSIMTPERKSQEIIMLVGPPGSGKSTYAEKIKKYKKNFSSEDVVKTISSDSIRKELYGHESIQGSPQDVFSIVEQRAKEFLGKGYTIILDSCNLSRKRRMHMIQRLKSFNVPVGIITIICDIETIIDRCSQRERTCSKDVIVKLLGSFNVPIWHELKDAAANSYIGFDFDKDEIYRTGDSMLEDAMHFDQCNKNHKLTLGKHCERTKEILEMSGFFSDKDLLEAAKYHDIGKLYTKKFTNYCGKPTEEAHYYGHANVSAYVYLSLNRKRIMFDIDSVSDIAHLIENHMLYYYNMSEKTKEKYYKMYGARFMERLWFLHLADKKSKKYSADCDFLPEL
jgi:predicted kinase